MGHDEIVKQRGDEIETRKANLEQEKEQCENLAKKITELRAALK